MSDFATRLESQLREAAIRQEERGPLRRVALPRLRVAVPGFAATAIALTLLALAVAAVTVILRSEPQRAATLPSALEGEWRIPAEAGTEPGQTETEPGAHSLQLLPDGSERCADVGIDSGCYAIDTSAGKALEWGEIEVSGQRITFERRRGRSAGPPGEYRWTVRGGSLILEELSDPVRDRQRTLTAGPLTSASSDAGDEQAPEGWLAKRFTSERYGYTIRFPAEWSALPASGDVPEGAVVVNTSDFADRLSRDPRGTGLPLVLIGAGDAPASGGLAAWTAAVERVATERGGCDAGERRGMTIGGEPARITVFPYCGSGHTQYATFLHEGRAFQVSWWGDLGRHEADRPLFEALLRSIELTR